MLALGGFAGIIWYSYTEGLRAGDARAVPLVRADLTPLKVAPKDPGGVEVPNKDMLIYDRLDGGEDGGRARQERITPDEELALAPNESAPTAPAGSRALTSDGAVKTIPKTDIKGVRPLAPATTPATTPATGAKAAPKHGSRPVQTAQYMGPFRVQLAAYRTSEAAARSWRAIQGRHKDLLGRLNPIIQKADLGKKGLYFRLQAGPLASRAEASALCAKLKKRKVGCLVVKL